MLETSTMFEQSQLLVLTVLIVNLLTWTTLTSGIGSGREAGSDQCTACKLASQSVDELLRQPRQMDSYGRMGTKIDLDKIKKAVCRDIINDNEREQCRQFYFSQSTVIKKWASNGLTNAGRHMSFLDFVCIRELKICCPSNSFGPKCAKCPSTCSINEQCHGEGTRTGNGGCTCKEGHTGSKCATCLPGYYLDSGHGLQPASCRPCHKSCQYCRHGGPLGCEVCSKGFNWLADYGCADVDECTQSGNKICGPNTFCVNTEGSYFCYECDRACDGCHGDGPDQCLRCKRGYKLDASGNCVATKKTILPPEANYYRYAIYLGLSVSTCIILHNNVYLASVIGLGVAMYIGVSEYVMSGQPMAGAIDSQAPISANPRLGL